MDADGAPRALIRIHLLMPHRNHLAASQPLEEPGSHVRIGMAGATYDLRAAIGPLDHNRGEQCLLHDFLVTFDR
jgi:hypothetical protein